MERLKNEKLTLLISEHGAELQSIRDAEGKEYLWEGDKRYWGGQSPLLFPIVGRLWKDAYSINGKEIEMQHHGFARHKDFKLIAKGENQVVFGLTDDEETYKVYPFHFNLAVSYKLVDNKIHVVWHIENTDIKDIYFQIGGHPAFNVPGCKKGEEMTVRMRMNDAEPKRLYANSNGYIEPKYLDIETKDGIWEVEEDAFTENAVIFDHSQIKHIEILGEDNQPVVSVDLKAPAVGIWNPCNKAPFVCIEPWYGISDWANYDGDFKDRYLMNKLAPGASFMSEYVITIK